jgi:hypothetical protein
VHAPSTQDFKSLYADKNKPVLITGVVSKWGAYSMWKTDYFNSFAADRSVPVKHMVNGSYLGAITKIMKLKDYLEIIDKPVANKERYYLSEQPVADLFPEIVNDYSVPEYIESDKYLSVCYIGSNVNSQIHFHPYGKALLCVVSGRKRVKLFAPDQTRYLYQKFNFSKINDEPVNLKDFPLYKNAKYYECEVNAGEMLFFPIYWWHAVETDDFTTALVFFWDDPRKVRWHPPAGISWYHPIIFEVSSWIIKGRNSLNYIENLFKKYIEKY